MWPFRRSCKTLLTIWALGAVLAWAAPPPAAGGPVLDLPDCLRLALKRSHQVAASRQDLKKSHLAKKEAFTGFLPTLSTSYNWVYQGQVPTFNVASTAVPAATRNTYSWSTSLSQPVFTGFRLSSQYKLATLGLNLAQLELTLTKLDLVLQVTEAYFNFLTAQKAVEVAQAEVRGFSSQLRSVNDFYKVGIRPVNEVLRAKVQLANARQNLVRARGALRITQSRLNRLLVRPVNSPLAVRDLLFYRKWPITLKQAQDKARIARPEITAIMVRLRQADQRIRIAKSEYYPSLGVGLTSTMQSESADLGSSDFHDRWSWQITGGLTWNFFEFGRTRHRVGQQKAEKLRIKALRRDLLDQISLQVKEAHIFLRESERNISTARTAVVQARENLRITRARFEEQLTTNTEVLDAQTLLTQAQNNYFQALGTYHLARARLLRAMGLGLPGGAQSKPAVRPRSKKAARPVGLRGKNKGAGRPGAARSRKTSGRLRSLKRKRASQARQEKTQKS